MTQIPTLAEARAQLDCGATSSVELVQACFARIDAHEADVHAFVTETRELALRRAAESDQRRRAGQTAGPLDGIPYSLKDIVATKDILTSANSRTLAQHVPQVDARVAAALQEAGGVLMGKATTWEFAHGGPSWDILTPPAHNPWHVAHDPAGSSSGSAVGVASGFALASIGSDTGGSIRGPAAVCGVTGLKPTYGRVSRVGVIGNSYTHDHVGPIAWTAEDAAMVLQAIAGHDPQDPASSTHPVADYLAHLDRPLTGLRIGVPFDWFERQVPASAVVLDAFRQALKVFEQQGAKVQAVTLPPIKRYEDAKKMIAAVELFATHGRALRETPELLGEAFRVRVFGGALVSAESYLDAQRLRKQLTAATQLVLDEVDVIALPTAEPAGLLKPPVPEAFFSRDGYLTPFCVSGHPALSTRAGFTSESLPLSLQLVGRHFDEALVLNVAHRYEQATEWRHHRPAFL